MIELADLIPDTNVQPAEYKRLLGYPRDRMLEGRSRELGEWARAWYARHGRPWVYAREVESLAVANGSISLDGVAFSSPRLQKTLADAEAHSAILVAVSAGEEVEREAARLWREEKPDEYFFLEIFGSAVVEHLTITTGGRLCAWAEGRGMAVLPHYSPGYEKWDIAQQAALLELVRRTRGQNLPGRLEVLESGMLRPKKSLLAVFGVTKLTDRVRRLTDLIPCENCTLASCQFRRTPYRRSAEYVKSEVPAVAADEEAPSSLEASEPLDRAPKYLVNAKALARWADERLTLHLRGDGSIDALFRYDGTTCTNTGRAMTFHYNVKLGPRDEGYPLREMKCGPAPGDEGHRFMCRYMNNAEHLMVAIDREKPPLLGKPLNDVLAWKRPAMGPGCYCEPDSRAHKWGLALETLHWALSQREVKGEKTAIELV